MIEVLKNSLWQQFGAAIDTLDDALTLCPHNLWEGQVWADEDDDRYGQFWFIAYHTLFWLDLYFTGSMDGFLPPKPFIRGKLPNTPYTKDDVSRYLNECRQKCEAMIDTLTNEKAAEVCTFQWMQPSYLELQFYNMRHVQEHASHLGLFLGQNGITGIDWIANAR